MCKDYLVEENLENFRNYKKSPLEQSKSLRKLHYDSGWIGRSQETMEDLTGQTGILASPWEQGKAIEKF